MKYVIVMVLILGIVFVGCSETITQRSNPDSITYKGITYDISNSDVIYFADGVIEFANIDKDGIILIKGDKYFYPFSFNDIVYFVNEEIQRADFDDEDVVILIKGDDGYSRANFDDIIVFENQKPVFFEFPEKSGIMFILKENGNFKDATVINNEAILVIQNGKYYEMDSKIKQIILESGERIFLK